LDNNSNLEYNTGLTNSYIEYNNIFYGLLSGNTLLDSSYISDNFLENVFVYDNELSGSTVDFNQLFSLSEINTNNLINSNISKNNFTSESYLINGVFINASFEKNSLKNSIINLVECCEINTKNISLTNAIDSDVNDITENSITIYGNFSKNIFTNSSGLARLSYYDATDLQIITNTDDSILPGLVISSWSPTGQYSIDVTVNVTSDGGDSVTQRGVVWATNKYPTISDNILVDGGTGTGVYTESLTGLTADSIIYFRGYSINGNGTGYTCQDTYSTVITP
jgi:hypothetical protein